MKRLLALLAFLSLAATTASIAQADDPRQYPAFSLARLTVGARAEASWWEGKDAAVLPSFKFQHEIGVGAVASYAVIPNFALTGRAIYYLDSKLVSYSIGVNVLVFSGEKYSHEVK
jgi:hypothetical protein